MRAYVDTNILVDLVLARQEFLPNAQRVFALGYAGEVQLVVSALSFVNTIYLGRKYKYPMNEVCRDHGDRSLICSPKITTRASPR